MLPYILCLDVWNFYFSYIHGYLEEYKTKGICCAGVYCFCRLLFKLYHARRNQVKRRLRRLKGQFNQKYEDILDQLDDQEHPLDESVADLSFQDVINAVNNRRLDTSDLLLIFKLRALSVDVNCNAIAEFLQNDITMDQEQITTSKDGAQPLLLNLPISLAEVIQIEGMDATTGLSSYLQLQASEDAVVVQLLKAQGAIPILRTNVSQTAYTNLGSSNPIYGLTKNPVRANRSPGGCCSGEAVIAAVRGSVLGVGTDIAGGLRIPAHFCGVCGFKPTSLRVSNKGITGPVEGQTIVTACVGPISSEVAGLVAFMKSVCVPLQHRLDPTVANTPFDIKEFEATEPLCVGVFIDDGYTKCVPAVRRAVHEAQHILAAAGHKIVPFKPPDLLHMLVKLYLPTVLGDHYQTFIRYLAIDSVDRNLRRTYYLIQIPFLLRWFLSWGWNFTNPVNASLVALKLPQSVSNWWKQVRATEAWKEDFISRMNSKGINVLLCPVLPFAAVNVGSEESYTGCLTYCTLFNLMDFPAGTVSTSFVSPKDIEDLNNPTKYVVETTLEKNIKKDQLGRMSNPPNPSLHLPVGVQVASLPFKDEIVLRVLKQLESHRNQRHR